MTVGLDTRMDVYTRGSGGAFDVLDKADIPCRFFHIRSLPSATGEERSELAAIRNLHYSPVVDGESYTLPDRCQIEVVEDGVTRRYNPKFGTEGDIRPFAAVIQRRIDVVRAEEG